MKVNSLKHIMLISIAASHHMSLGTYVQYNPRCLKYDPGSEARFSRGNSGVRQAQRKAKKLRNIRARSAK